MGVKFANNAYGTLNASISSSDASLTLTSGQGARFPSLGAGDYFYCTLIDTSNNLEVVKCTARSSDVLTITRAQESTTARAFTVGDRVELRVTAAGLEDNLDNTDIDVILPAQASYSGQFLTTDGTNASWATAGTNASNLSSGTLPSARLPAGAIIQLKHFVADGEFSSSSTSFTNTSLITASFDNTLQSGSKVYATLSATIGEVYANAWANPVYLTLYQGTSSANGSNIGDSTRGMVGGNAIANASGVQANQYDMARLTGVALHTPSNTDPYYRLFMRSSAAFTRYVGSAANSSSNYDVGRTQVTIFEVAG